MPNESPWCHRGLALGFWRRTQSASRGMTRPAHAGIAVVLGGSFVSLAGSRAMAHGVRWRRAAIWLAAMVAGHAVAGHAQNLDDLRALSIEQLGEIRVTSVAKAVEPLSDAPAAIYVISHDDIIRSGAQTIPELLRLAPNLEVAQLNATTYAISARGFNVGDNASLSNKLLVLIDGRSVYTPMFGGVYWDMQS